MQKPLCVGIVEDSREDFQALCRILGPGVDVWHWKSGEQAQAAFAAGGLHGLALVIVDCNLPGMDGVDLVRELRGAPGGAKVKVAMLSGALDVATTDRARSVGVDRCEGKGTTLQELKAALARCLDLITPNDRSGDAVPA